MSKDILIVGRSFYPMITPRAFRATELAKEFAKQGNRVTVLTQKCDFDYSEFEETHNVRIEDFTNNKWKVIKGRNILKRSLRFALRYFFLYPDIQLTKFVSDALQFSKTVDILISIANPYSVHWGVVFALKKNPDLSKVWIADCGDPFMGNTEQKIKNPFYFRYVENWFCKNAQFIVVPIKEAIPSFPDFCRNKIRVIPQGFNFEQIIASANKREEGTILFGYAGSLSKGIRDPGHFLEYLCSKHDVKFKFIIYTRNISVIETFIERLGNKIEVRDYIPREELLAEMKGMDFVVNFENRSTVQSPSKLIDYALIDRPVLSIIPSQLEKESIDQFLSGDYSKRLIINDIEQYNIKNVAKKFLALSE